MGLVSGMAGKAGLRELKELLAAGGLPELGPGPRAGILPHAELSQKLDGLLTNTTLPSVSRDLIRALILLWHDRMDPAHDIAQAIENADGSFVHGILHRREPDYGNAAYWFRRVGAHKAYPALTERVEQMLAVENAHPLKLELIPDGEWDPFAFIRLCEKASGKPPTDAQVNLLRKVQGIESEVLLEQFCKQ
jgi:hypothetical protein